MNYKQLTGNARCQIDVMNKAGHSQKEIAELLARSGAPQRSAERCAAIEVYGAIVQPGRSVCHRHGVERRIKRAR